MSAYKDLNIDRNKKETVIFMTNTYSIIDTNKSLYKAIVTALTTDSLSDYFSAISTDLSKKAIKGKVLLDYYSSTFSNTNRFFEIDFNGNTFAINTMHKTKLTNTDKKYIRSLYKQHINTPQNPARIVPSLLSICIEILIPRSNGVSSIIIY